ncbi:hypothetical protein BVRB_028460, partial [Beta vulgaris subsp. vulgaris]
VAYTAAKIMDCSDKATLDAKNFIQIKTILDQIEEKRRSLPAHEISSYSDQVQIDFERGSDSKWQSLLLPHFERLIQEDVRGLAGFPTRMPT